MAKSSKPAVKKPATVSLPKHTPIIVRAGKKVAKPQATTETVEQPSSPATVETAEIVGPVAVQDVSPNETVNGDKKPPKTAYQVQAGSKMEAAIKIFNEMVGKPRKDCIGRFINEAGLTKAGSGTYYFNLTVRKRKGQI